MRIHTVTEAEGKIYKNAFIKLRNQSITRHVKGIFRVTVQISLDVQNDPNIDHCKDIIGFLSLAKSRQKM